MTVVWDLVVSVSGGLSSYDDLLAADDGGACSCFDPPLTIRRAA